jgi:hypothetical protein
VYISSGCVGSLPTEGRVLSVLREREGREHRLAVADQDLRGRFVRCVECHLRQGAPEAVAADVEDVVRAAPTRSRSRRPRVPAGRRPARRLPRSRSSARPAAGSWISAAETSATRLPSGLHAT